MSEAKGPYFEKEDYSVHSMNAAYAEGFKAGRASRDGLRKAAESVMIAMDIKKYRAPRGFFDMANPALEALDKALAEDDKEAGNGK